MKGMMVSDRTNKCFKECGDNPKWCKCPDEYHLDCLCKCPIHINCSDTINADQVMEMCGNDKMTFRILKGSGNQSKSYLK